MPVQVRWPITDVATRLPPLHTLSLYNSPMDSDFLADLRRCVTSAQLVSVWWAYDYIPPQGTRLPWPTTQLQRQYLMKSYEDIHDFLRLAERIEGGHSWELDTLNVRLSAEQVWLHTQCRVVCAHTQSFQCDCMQETILPDVAR